MLRRIVLCAALCGTLLSSGCSWCCGHSWFKRRCCPDNCATPACPPAGSPANFPAGPPPGAAVVTPPPGSVSQFGPTPDVVAPKPTYSNGVYR